MIQEDQEHVLEFQYNKNYSTIYNQAREQNSQRAMWARMDSNHRTPKRTDLQSVAVGHLATCPSLKYKIYLLIIAPGSNPGVETCRASGGIRTPDQLITNQLLWPTELHWHFVVSPHMAIGYLFKKQAD